MVLSSQFAFKSIVSKFSQEIDARVRSHSESFAKAAMSRANDAARVNASIAKNDLIVNGIIDLEHRESTLRSFFRSLMLPGPETQSILMTDYRGKPILHNSHIDLTLDSEDSIRFVQEMELLKPLWKPTVLDEGKTFIGIRSGNLVVASPILYSNQPEGALLSIFPVDEFFADLLEKSATRVTGIEYEGQVVVSSNEEILKTDSALSSPDGWLASTAQVPGLSQLTVVVLESGQTVAAASNAVFLVLGFYLLACSFGILATVIASSYMVTNPLSKLVLRIKELQQTANLSLRVNEDGPLEISNLSSDFNKMLAKLNDTTVSQEVYRKLALVAKYTDNAVVITDAHGLIEWVNDGFVRITGYEIDDVVGKTPGSILQGEKTDPQTTQAMRDAVKHQRGFDVEIVNYTKSGEAYWVAIESRPILNSEGVVEKFIAIERDISARIQAEQEREKLSRELQESARAAGMAEIATGVLHNVGNVLNSINVSTHLLTRSCRESRLASLVKARDLFESNREDLANFLTKDKQGIHFPEFFKQLVNTLSDENQLRIEELETLGENVNHVKEIISFQQSYARQGGIDEPVYLDKLVDSVLKMNQEKFDCYEIKIRRDYNFFTCISLNKHKLLQILINLITNAKHALRDSKTENKELVISIREVGENIEITVADNGVGISPKNIEKIFAHGFTTKDDGHGFGLHSSALAAKELNGSLYVNSDGEGHGATFGIQIPKPADNPTIAPTSAVSTAPQTTPA